MNLRWTILGIILITFVGLVAILTFSLQGILVPYFREEEERAVNLNVQRVIGVLENERGSITQIIRNWAGSDASYNFIRSADPGYIQTYLSESMLPGLNIDLLVYLDLEGEIAFSHNAAQSNSQNAALPVELTNHFQPGDPLVQTASSQDAFSGMLATSRGPLLVISAPLLNNGKTQAVGTLIAGRYMDSDELSRISGVVRFPLMLEEYNRENLPQDFSIAKETLTLEQPITANPASVTQISGFALITDISGEPAYILRVEQGRSIYRNSQIVLMYLYTAMIMGALLFSIMTFLAFDRLALARIRLLGREVTQIGAGGDLSARVTVARNDELTRVAVEINDMLASLQTLSYRLVDIQESERRMIALELHDEIGQLLTGLKLQLDTIAKNGAALTPHYLTRARELTDELIQKVRNLSLDLRPTMLDDLGLLPALLWHIDRFTALTGVEVDFSQNGVSDRRFAPELESTVYRIVQEALTNVARHSGVQQVSLRATYRDDTLIIQVEDRGSGFSLDPALDSNQTRGLRGMQERVALVGGSLTIDSVPGWGTSILVEFPAKSLPEEGRENDHNFTGG